MVGSGGTQLDNHPVLAREGTEWLEWSTGKKKQQKQKTNLLYLWQIPIEHLLCAWHCRWGSTEAAAFTLHNTSPRTHLLWYPQAPAGVRRVILQAGLARAKGVGPRNLYLAQRGTESGILPLFQRL